MLLAFKLSMPRNNSWNGKWSGDERLYVVVRSYQGAKGGAKAQKILDSQPYHYNWSDGWGARIDVEVVTNAEAKKLRAKSAGFCGYEWMINTIERYGKPLAHHEIPAETTAVVAVA